MTTLSQILQRQEYAGLVAQSDYDGLRDALNAKNVSAIKPTFITELGILAALGPTAGHAFLAAIEGQEQAMPALSRVVRWIRSERGVDIGNSDVRTVLDQLAAANVVSSESATTVKALAVKTTSVAERDLGRPVTEADIMDALNVAATVKYFDADGNEVQQGQPYAYMQETRG